MCCTLSLLHMSSVTGSSETAAVTYLSMITLSSSRIWPLCTHSHSLDFHIEDKDLVHKVTEQPAVGAAHPPRFTAARFPTLWCTFLEWHVISPARRDAALPLKSGFCLTFTCKMCYYKSWRYYLSTMARIHTSQTHPCCAVHAADFTKIISSEYNPQASEEIVFD